MTCLVERVEKLRDKRRSLARSTKNTLETEPVEVADKATCTGAESERISPEVPLESDDRGRKHTRPDEGQSGLSTRKTRIEEGQKLSMEQHSPVHHELRLGRLQLRCGRHVIDADGEATVADEARRQLGQPVHAACCHLRGEVRH